MTDISKGNHKHMTLSDRIIIEQGLNQQMTFKSIAASIEKDVKSISNFLLCNTLEEKEEFSFSLSPHLLNPITEIRN